MTVLNEAVLRFMLIPAWAQLDFSAFMVLDTEVVPPAYCKLKASFAPAGIPAPHSLDAVPGFWQVEVPLGTTFQPCELSRLLALDGL